jgi:nickel-dependent lactate racemase
MLNSESPKAMIERVKVDFELGGHKAAAIALVLENSDIYLVSEMDSKFVESIFLKPYDDTQKAFDDAFAKFGPDASVIVMPYGGSTWPLLKS